MVKPKVYTAGDLRPGGLTVQILNFDESHPKVNVDIKIEIRHKSNTETTNGGGYLPRQHPAGNPVYLSYGKKAITSKGMWAKQDYHDDKCRRSGYKTKYKEKDGNYIQWLLDGGKAMLEMCDAFCKSTKFIYIIASYFSPGINLVRTDADYNRIYTKYKVIIDKVKDKNRQKEVNEDRIPLISLLSVKADEGVNVRIILFRPDSAQDGFGGPFGWDEAQKIVHNWSDKIDMVLDTWGPCGGHEIGGHHQKSAVAANDEGLIGFCGGVDAAFARWALPSHNLTLANKYPVIVIPGIMGSGLRRDWFENLELKFKSETIWPTLSGTELRKLAMKSDGSDVLPNIEVDGIILDFHGTGYKDLLEYFNKNGYSDDLLVACPYDWRRHLKYAAGMLSARIDNLQQKRGIDKVIIVAHSMGGLVARYFASSGNASKIRRLIQLGTPNHGSPKSYLMIKFGKEGPIPWYVPEGPNESDYLASCSNMQGIYHLLPDAGYFSLYKGKLNEQGQDGGVFETNKSYTDPTEVYQKGATALPNTAMAKEAMDTYNNVLGDVSHCADTHIVVGHAVAMFNTDYKDTIGRVEVDTKKPKAPKTLDTIGDKTVPMKSAENLTDVYRKKGTNLHYYPNINHVDLAKDKNVLERALSLVEDARIGGDPLDLPIRVDLPLKIEPQMNWINPDSVMGEWDGKKYKGKGSQVLWHDVHAKVVGPAAFDLADNFVERYQRATSSTIRTEIDPYKDKPAPSTLLSSDEGYSQGKIWSQIVRSYDPADDYGIWDSYRNLFSRAVKNIYIESQYAFEDEALLNILIDNVSKREELKVIIVAPVMPDNYDLQIIKNLRKLINASIKNNDPNTARVTVFSLLSNFGDRRIPIYVHAKVAIVDDEWAIVGSANLDRMGMGGKGSLIARGSSELCILVHGSDQATALRRVLAQEHLGSGAAGNLNDFGVIFDQFRQEAAKNRRPKDKGPLTGQLVFHRLYKNM
jgi:phosphatidylserine/phosphatidylglycerophosphate/cardiolipin synthase-like enzyme